jgi:parallel beta-helix repeat protein
MSSRFVMPFANVGDGITPADGAKLQFYASGTSTPKDTYSDEDLTTANANPVIADADGLFGDIWMDEGDRYKVRLYDKNNVQQWESDPVIGGLNGASGLIYDTVADMKAASPLVGQAARTLGYYAAGDGGGGNYVIAATAAVDGYVDHSLANATIAVAQLQKPINPRIGGVKFDGTDDTVAMQAVLDHGESWVDISGGTARVDELVIPTSLHVITGDGELKQRTTSTGILTATGASRLTITGIKITGNYSTGQITSDSADTGIEIISSSDVTIERVKFSRINFISMYIKSSTNCQINRNYIKECNAAVYLRGCNGVDVVGNICDTTIAADSFFSIPITCESTDGHFDGVSENINIQSNIIKSWRNAQGIMAHAGKTLNIQGNIIIDVAIGISINPYNATDVCENVVIDGNTCIGSYTIPGYAGGNDGITCQAGVGTPDINGLVISNNLITNMNVATSTPANQGGIRLGDTVKAVVSGNTIRGCKENGIVLTSDEDQFVITGNLIADVVASSGTQNGIVSLAYGARGVIEGNYFFGIGGGTGIGIKLTNASSIKLKANSFENVDTNVSGNQNSFGPDIVTVSSGTECDLNGVDGAVFTHSSATNIDTWVGVVVGKIYSLRFTNGNTTITRTNAYLNGSANQVGSANDIMLVMGLNATTVQQVAPISVNG